MNRVHWGSRASGSSMSPREGLFGELAQAQCSNKFVTNVGSIHPSHEGYISAHGLCEVGVP